MTCWMSRTKLRLGGRLFFILTVGPHPTGADLFQIPASSLPLFPLWTCSSYRGVFFGDVYVWFPPTFVFSQVLFPPLSSCTLVHFFFLVLCLSWLDSLPPSCRASATRGRVVSVSVLFCFYHMSTSLDLGTNVPPSSAMLVFRLVRRSEKNSSIMSMNGASGGSSPDQTFLSPMLFCREAFGLGSFQPIQRLQIETGSFYAF